jgi:IS30 family transposase
MSARETAPYKQLDLERRKIIEQGLGKNRTFTYIAREAGVSVSTIRREVLRNRRNDGMSYARGKDKTDCQHLKACKIKSLCDPYCEKRLCKRCEMRLCQDICNDYEMRICDTVEKAPFVCNACERYGRCTVERYRYSAESADAAARRRSAEARNGIDLTEDEMKAVVDTVYAGLAKGQSIHHIFEAYELPCGERSFYRYVEDQSIPVKSIDLAKKVRYKKRKKKKAKTHGAGFFAGHEYDDFMELPEEDRAVWTEVDTVCGKRGGRKCILSLHRVDLHFQIYLLLQEKTKGEAVRALDWLEECCDGHFREFFGLLLLDRGTEFDDIAGIERSCETKTSRCAAYFCDPNRPDQKGSCEKNHVELRKVVPKGTSLQGMDACTLADICSHVNSTIRKGCGDVSPIQMAMLCLPQALFDNLGLKHIPAKDVVSAPGILYKPEKQPAD